MSVSILPLPKSFVRAFTLAERVAFKGTPESDDESRDLGRVRVDQHRALSGLKESAARMLRWRALGITEQDGHLLFSEATESLHKRAEHLPIWAMIIQSVYGVDEPLPLNGKGFAGVAAPLVAWAEKEIAQRLKVVVLRYSNLPSWGDLPRVLTAGLESELARMLQRTLVLEMHVARLEGRLTGETSQERFEAFLKLLGEPGAMWKLFDEYPVLARVLAERAEQAVNVQVELVDRLCASWSALVETFGLPDNPGPLVSAKSAGDRHDGGRAVTMLRWASGAELVYKPKPLSVDVHFQELITWVNRRGAEPALPILQVLDRGDHGYTAVVRPTGCDLDEEVGKFFERQGQLLAIFYGLLATDFDCENVIACGEYPYPIDLESLFHGEIGPLENGLSDGALESEIVYSVLRVGLLPERAREGAAGLGVDLSGLGGEEGQLSALPQPYWENPGTDEMVLGRKLLPVVGGENLPTLRGRTAAAFLYTDRLVSGLNRMYRLLVEHRGELLESGGPFAKFENDVVRIIARPTRVYASLLGESYHPDLMRDALDRDIYFDRLWSFSPERAHLSVLVGFEQADLWRGDIPKWITLPGSRDLIHSHGKVERFFKTPGLDLARDHVSRFCSDDLTKQRWIVRAAMTTLATDARRAKWSQYVPEQDLPSLSSEELVQSAERIGNWLIGRAICGGNEVNWLGLAFVGDHWVLAPLGTDLYGGLLGVALFLAQLAEVTGKEKYRDFAERAMRTWVRKERDGVHKADSVGGYGGLGAAVYGLGRLAVMLNRAEYLELAHQRLPIIQSLIAKDSLYDVLSGSAGAIGALVAFHDMTQHSSALEVAHRAAEHLISNGQQMLAGKGWPISEAEGRALAGFSHGAGGIAWALLRLFEKTGEETYRREAMEAISYERSQFVEAEGNYYDLRPAMMAARDAPFTYAWCHGAPGIGLARLAHVHLLDEKAQDEVKVTVNTTLRALGRGHCACHGDLGNLELPLSAAREWNDDQTGKVARAGLAAAVRNGEKVGWLSGVPLSVETPGLMVGLSGMGYQLLRFAHPERVPSILRMEPQSMR
ncbi:MAG: type 2 lantipeptide synthetase LanM family protein [Polyangiaceae bacterium]|nr:type 2 lantipeptide synthetase LanM family protein [Polyangiaceae bacterium]